MSFRKPLFIFMLGLVLAVQAGCGSRQVKVAGVRILDTDFRVIRTLSAPEELRAFMLHWNSREQVTVRQAPRFGYKIDVTGSDGFSVRWLWDSSGYVLRLTKMKTPLYRIRDTEGFRKLLLP